MNKQEREHVAVARDLIAQFNANGNPDCLWYADEHLRLLEGLPLRRHPLEGIRAVPISEVAAGPNREFSVRVFTGNGWRCTTCGRANIYHDPDTGRCPEPDDDAPKVG